MSDEQDRKSSEKVGDWVSIFQRGATWYANYQFNGRQVRTSLKTDNKKNAIVKARELDRKLSEGQSPTKIEAATINDVINSYKDYIVAEQRSQKTKSKYWGVLSHVESIATEMGRSRITQLDLAFVDKYRARRSKSCESITVYHETVIIRQMVKFAVSRRMTPIDPLAGLRLKRPKPKSQPYFDNAQIQQILSAARPPHDATFLLLSETGLRIGEAQWLTWADVDLNSNVIHVRGKDDWKPKTGDERAIPISAKLRAFLEGRPHRGRWVLTAMPTKKYPSQDRQIDESRALKALKRVLAPLGLAGKLHSFRHSFISRCLTKGIEESVVRAWVGHVDPQIMHLYTHISSRISQDRIQRLGAVDGDDPAEKDGPKPSSA
jgi:integrase